MTNRIVRDILNEYKNVLTTLLDRGYIAEPNYLSINVIGDNEYLISWSGRAPEANITFMENSGIGPIVDLLLTKRQFSLLLYDKSILQAEYIIKKDKITKQRFQFIKKHNKVWTKEEIALMNDEITEDPEADWFSEDFGIPIYFRVDYDPEQFCDTIHPKCHFVFSNIKDCRIPMKANLTLTKFVEFILNQIYNDYDTVFPKAGNPETEISEAEKKHIHINW